MAPLSRESFITRTLGINGVAAAGSSIVDGWAGSAIDTANVEGVYFLFNTQGGSTGGNVVFSVRQSTATTAERSSGGQGTALTGASVTITAGSSATSESAVIDIYKPRRNGTANFLHGVYTVASSCTVAGPMFAIAYGWRQLGNSTATGTVPQSTASANGITGGVNFLLSPST